MNTKLIYIIKILVFVTIAVLVTMPTVHYFQIKTKNFEIEQLKEQYDGQMRRLNRQLQLAKDEIDMLYYQLDKANAVRVTLTWYHPGSGGINTDGDPRHTATMTIPKAGRTIAISTALVKRGWLGKRIYIKGHGVYIAEDRMNVELPGYRIDICAPNEDIAFENGIKHKVLCSRLIN